MDFKPTLITLFLLLLLATPCFSKGGSTELGLDAYEIDYRGPETHSSIPPPDHARGKPMIRREKTVTLPKTKGIGGGNNGGNNGKKIHG